MKNKIEFKKACVLSFSLIVLISVIFEIFLLFEYKAYTNNFNNKINMLVENVCIKYEDINKDEIVKILNNDFYNKSDILEKYGIDLKKDSIIIQNDKLFMKFSVINLCFIIVSFISILIIFVRYNSLKDKKLAEITKYIEQINNRNYKLDIEDNTEDELSILKNEIYKTTVMLKEVAQNSILDKVNLKRSLSDISHQLKTPLTSISVMLDNIIDDPQMDSKTRTEFINDIKREIININFLVNSLLKLSKLEANSVHFINNDVYIYKIINEAIKNVEVLCDLKNVSILVRGDNKIKINCDMKWQVEAITNILKNCVEYSSKDSIVEISYEQNGVYSQIEIKDHGVGIERKDLPHIFERFYKGSNSSSDSIGIGLALAKSIIQSSNGYIFVESNPGLGSVFKVKYFKN